MSMENKKYNIIYADPAWEYNNKSMNRGGAERYYNTCSVEEMGRLPIKDLQDEKCICFMWATFPNIQKALDLMELWGFEYKTVGFVWIKKNKKNKESNFWGMGMYTRANAEICLIGVNKSTKPKDIIINHGVHQIVEEPIAEHSRKPQLVRDLIIKLCGDIPRVELFARQKTEGWDVWGNEVESDINL